MSAGQRAGGAAGLAAADQGLVASSAADLTESMMHIYGPRVPLEVIAQLVHGVLDSAAHPHGAPVPNALGRQVVRRLRELIYADDPASHPVPSGRAQEIARTLQGRRA